LTGRIPPWWWIALLAFSLRLFHLDAERLWYDEAFTWWITRLSGADFWTAIAGDVHPPLWYLVEWLTVRMIGSSEFALRLPAVLFGTGAVVLVYVLAQHFTTRRGAVYAGLIAALLPAAGLYYSQEARMYAMLAFFLLTACIAAVRGRWVWYTLAALLAVYTQNLAVLYVLAIGLAGIGTALLASDAERRFALRAAMPPVLANLAVCIGWLPWGLVMLGQMGNMAQGFWLWPLLGVGDLLWPLVGMTLGLRLPGGVQVHAFVLVTALTLVALITARRWLWSRRGLLLLAATFGAPAIAVGVSLLWQPVFLPRAFILSAFLLAIWWAAALESLSQPNRRLAGGLLAAVLLIGVVSYYAASPDGVSQAARQDVAAFMQPIHDDWQDGDVIYHTNITTAIMGGYYSQGLDYRLWPHASDLNQGLTEQTKAAMGFDMATPDELDANRVWLIWQTNPMSTMPEQEATMAFLEQYPHRLAGTLYDNPLGRVALYEVWTGYGNCGPGFWRIIDRDENGFLCEHPVSGETVACPVDTMCPGLVQLR
jgi:hypothetical protein